MTKLIFAVKAHPTLIGILLMTHTHLLYIQHYKKLMSRYKKKKTERRDKVCYARERITLNYIKKLKSMNYNKIRINLYMMKHVIN